MIPYIYSLISNSRVRGEIDIQPASPTPEIIQPYHCYVRPSNEEFDFGPSTTWEVFRPTVLRWLFPTTHPLGNSMHDKLKNCELVYRFTELHRLEEEYPLDSLEDFVIMLQQMLSKKVKKIWVREWTGSEMDKGVVSHEMGLARDLNRALEMQIIQDMGIRKAPLVQHLREEEGKMMH